MMSFAVLNSDTKSRDHFSAPVEMISKCFDISLDNTRSVAFAMINTEVLMSYDIADNVATYFCYICTEAG